MKKTMLMLTLAATLNASATTADNDTVVIKNPRRVTVITNDSLQKIVVNGREGDDDYKYQNTILLPGHDREAAACFHVGFRITLAVCLLFALTIPFSEGISGLLHAPGLARHYALLPLYMFALSLWTMLNYW